MTRQEAARLVGALVAATPSQSARLPKERLEGMVDAYAALLVDIPYEQADQALRVLLQTSNWMPSVAEIRAAVAELGSGPVRAGGEAWQDVLDAVSRYGSYREPRFTDPVTARCVDALSWQGICLSENQVADRARFIELYDRLAKDQRRVEVSPVLARSREAISIGGAVNNIMQQLPELFEKARSDE